MGVASLTPGTPRGTLLKEAVLEEAFGFGAQTAMAELRVVLEGTFGGCDPLLITHAVLIGFVVNVVG